MLKKRCNMKYLKAVSLMMILAAASFNTLRAQDDKKDQEVKKLIEDKNFVFFAQTASPTGAPLRQLSYGFDLRVLGDSVVSYLPYFGRAYSAPIDPSDGGFHFTSTSFDYKVIDRKKGGWDIIIKPKDTKDVREMALTTFDNGSSTLRVMSNNRQPISFNGYIAARK
jgi:hypothetical protein